MPYRPLACRPRMLLGIGLLVAVSLAPVAAVGQTTEPAPVRVQMTPAAAAARGFHPREEAFVQDVYARLMRYDVAARNLHGEENGAPATPDDYLTVALADLRTQSTGEGPLPSLSRERGPLVGLLRGKRCQKEDPCHVFYDVAWDAKPDAVTTAPPIGPVLFVTTFRVTLTLAKRTRTYSALVLYHGSADGRSVEPEFLDPLIPGLQEVVAEESPAVVVPWSDYTKSARYAAIKRRVLGQPASEQGTGPAQAGDWSLASTTNGRDRRPIGYLVGDDIVEAELQLAVMTTGIPCDPAPPPTPTYFEVTAEPRYTQGPPAPYVLNVNRKVLDGNKNELHKVMTYEELFTPNPVRVAGCPPAEIAIHGGKTNSMGYVEGVDTYYSGEEMASAPPACSWVTIQSFTFTMDGKQYALRTKYKVTYTRAGVTVKCDSGCPFP